MYPYGLDPLTNPLLYLVRHGSTEANETGKFRGHRDYPLDDEGMDAADEAAHFLSFRPIGFMASSTLMRATQTAQAIAPALQLNFDRNPGLLPWNIGRFAGKSRVE
jgi:broad specificity phosphatase PhoE